jgi:DNA-binding MarR family transcriptional regulator
MSRDESSSAFTESGGPAQPLGPPLIGALLRMPWERVRQRMLESLHEHGFDDLDAPHLNVLRYPGPHGTRPSQLAAQLGMTKQALNYLLGELERLGYIERHSDPDDLRSKRILLTARGRAAGLVIRESVAETERRWAEELGPKRYARLRALLLELNELV